jgi:hypothetical protein
MEEMNPCASLHCRGKNRFSRQSIVLNRGSRATGLQEVAEKSSRLFSQSLMTISHAGPRNVRGEEQRSI